MVPKSPFICGDALLPGQPAEDLALEGGGASPNLACHLINLQMPERIGTKTFIREHFVSERIGT